MTGPTASSTGALVEHGIAEVNVRGMAGLGADSCDPTCRHPVLGSTPQAPAETNHKALRDQSTSVHEARASLSGATFEQFHEQMRAADQQSRPDPVSKRVARASARTWGPALTLLVGWWESGVQCIHVDYAAWGCRVRVHRPWGCNCRWRLWVLRRGGPHTWTRRWRGR
jgi:hypothetical protein